MTQGTGTKVEGVEQAEKQVEPIQRKEEPTGKTYTEADFQKAVSKGLESMTRQLSLQEAEAKKATSQLKSKESDLKALQEDLTELEKLKLDDPEFRETYTSKKAIRDAQRAVDRATAELEDQRYETEKQAWAIRMAQKANELVRETGIEVKELETCMTEEEMEVKALRFEKANKGSAKETEGKPHFDSGAGSGAGLDLDKMSPDEKIKLGLTRKR